MGEGFFFIQKESFAAHAEIKIAAFRSLILNRNAPGTLRSAFKNDSMALFIGGEMFPRAVSQGNR